MAIYGIEQIGEKIKEQRKLNGWSQQDLAEMTGLDRTTIGALERNTHSDIGIRKVERILALFHLSLTVAHSGPPTLDDLLRERSQ